MSDDVVPGLNVSEPMAPSVPSVNSVTRQRHRSSRPPPFSNYAFDGFPEGAATFRPDTSAGGQLSPEQLDEQKKFLQNLIIANAQKRPGYNPDVVDPKITDKVTQEDCTDFFNSVDESAVLDWKRSDHISSRVSHALNAPIPVPNALALAQAVTSRPPSTDTPKTIPTGPKALRRNQSSFSQSSPSVQAAIPEHTRHITDGSNDSKSRQSQPNGTPRVQGDTRTSETFPASRFRDLPLSTLREKSISSDTPTAAPRYSRQSSPRRPSNGFIDIPMTSPKGRRSNTTRSPSPSQRPVSPPFPSRYRSPPRRKRRRSSLSLSVSSRRHSPPSRRYSPPPPRRRSPSFRHRSPPPPPPPPRRRSPSPRRRSPSPYRERTPPRLKKKSRWDRGISVFSPPPPRRFSPPSPKASQDRGRSKYSPSPPPPLHRLRPSFSPGRSRRSSRGRSRPRSSERSSISRRPSLHSPLVSPQRYDSPTDLPPPTHPRLPVPGNWFVKIGADVPRIVDASFDIDPDSWDAWNLTTDTLLRLRLYCVPTMAVTEAQKALSSADNVSPETLALAVSGMRTEWPPPGHVIIQLNKNKSHGRTWMPLNLKSGAPLDFTRHVQQGTNDLRFIQLGNLSEYTFVLTAFSTSDTRAWSAKDEFQYCLEKTTRLPPDDLLPAFMNMACRITDID